MRVSPYADKDCEIGEKERKAVHAQREKADQPEFDGAQRPVCTPYFDYPFFRQVTELGKMLDPLADKLTQGVVALCLAVKFPVIGPVLLVFIAKELVMLCGAVVLLKKQKRPCAAQWYGKVATVMFYVSVAVIVVMDGFLHVKGLAFTITSNVLLILTAAMMIYSAVKYFQIFREIFHSDDAQYELSLHDEIRAKTVREKRKRP